jgi:hypothetical protein
LEVEGLLGSKGCMRHDSRRSWWSREGPGVGFVRAAVVVSAMVGVGVGLGRLGGLARGTGGSTMNQSVVSTYALCSSKQVRNRHTSRDKRLFDVDLNVRI